MAIQTRLRAIPIGLLPAVMTTALLAGAYQFTSAQQRPTFRAGVDLVTLDVSVLDKERRPVRGLTAADFTVLEDGKPQTVEVFSAFDLPDPEPLAAGWMRTAPADVDTNAGDSHRLIAIVLDDVMLPFTPNFVNGAKTIARDIVSRMGPDDAGAIIFTMDNRKAQSFTTDKAKLLRAIETVKGGPAYMPRTDDSPFYIGSIATLMDVATDLISLPERRKILVHIGVGVPANPKARAWDMLHDTIERAQRANVTVYGFDPGGLDAMEGFCALKSVACKAPAQSFHNFLLIESDNTGGKATVFTNDPVPGIQQMFVENGSYYLLGYRQAIPQKTGDVRRMQVKVDRKDAEVRTRQYNRRERSDDEKADKAHLERPTASQKAVAEAIADATTPMRLNLLPIARPDGQGATVIVTVGVREPAPEKRGRETVDLLMRAFTLDGAARGTHGTTMRVDVAPARSTGGASTEMRFALISRLDIAKPGRYDVRIGIENHERNSTGSVFADLDVPDFTAPLSASGVALESDTSPTYTPSEPLKPLLPVVPTTDREFPATAQVATFFRIYEGGHGAVFPVTVKTTIRDKADAAVYSKTDSVGPGRFGTTRAADHRLELPLSQLPPGPYLLNFDISGHDRVVTRQVVFAIR